MIYGQVACSGALGGLKSTFTEIPKAFDTIALEPWWPEHVRRRLRSGSKSIMGHDIAEKKTLCRMPEISRAYHA
jgi:hypothetical protein